MNEETTRRILEHLGEELPVSPEEMLTPQDEEALLVALFGINGVRRKGAGPAVTTAQISALLESGLIRLPQAIAFSPEELVIEMTVAGHLLRKDVFERDLAFGDVLMEELERRRNRTTRTSTSQDAAMLLTTTSAEEQVDVQEMKPEPAIRLEPPSFPSRPNIEPIDIELPEEDERLKPAEMARERQERLDQLTALVVKTHLATVNDNEQMFATLNHDEIMGITEDDMTLLETITDSTSLIRITREVHREHDGPLSRD